MMGKPVWLRLKAPIQFIKINENVVEKIIFYGLLLFNVSVIWSVYTFPTFDGSTHTYNAGLLNLMKTDAFVQANFLNNSFFLSNYLCNFLISKCSYFTGLIVAEKIILSLIVVFLPLTFRQLVNVYSEHKTKFTLLIFPFVFNVLLIFGFYNFNYAFIFLNLHLIILHTFLKQQETLAWKLAFVINSLVLFYAHAMVYVLGCVLTPCLLLIYLRSDWKILIKQALWVLGLSGFSLVLFFLFQHQFYIPDYSYDPTIFKKIELIVKGSIFIGYADDELSGSVFIVLLIGVLLTLFLSKKRYSVFFQLTKYPHHFFLIVAGVMLALVFTTKDGWLSGMLTLRLLFICFYFIALWISIQPEFSRSLLYFSIGMVCLGNILCIKIKAPTLRDLSGKAKEVMQCSTHIRPHSYVMPIAFNVGWLEAHFANYAVLNKPIVLLESYQADLDWFPLKWRDKDKIAELKQSVVAYDSTQVKKLPDYILIVGDQSRLDNLEYRPLKNCITRHGNKLFTSTNSYCVLYQLSNAKVE